MKAIDIHGMTNMELVRGETDEWYWATDYIHGGLYEKRKSYSDRDILCGATGCISSTIRTVRFMRQSQAQIGVISTPICAFCRRSLGGFSVVSVQPCPPQSYSGSKVGQRL